MHTQQQMEERLWDFIDGLSSSSEKTTIRELIAVDTEWQQKYRELLEIHQGLNSQELEEPSMRFTKNVMEEITRYQVAPATKTYINKNIIRSIGAFFLLMIGSLLIYCLAGITWRTSSPSTSTPQYSINLDLEKLNIGKVFNSSYLNILILVTVVIGLVFLDVWLQRKKQAHQQA
jgi:hypothetical protein